ncbi:unnamed protein product [Musa textilis]
MAKRWWTGALVMGGAVPGVTLAPPLHLRNPNSADDHRKHHFNRREKETAAAAATNISDSNNNPNNDDGNAGGRATGTTGRRPHGSKNKPRPPVIITSESPSALCPHVLEIASEPDNAEAVTSFGRGVKAASES